MVKLFRTSHVLHTAIFVWAMFFPVALVLDRKDVFAFTGSLSFTTAVAVLHAYWPAMKLSLARHRKNFDYVDFLTLGIMCSWFALSARYAYMLILRQVVDIPDEFQSLGIAFLQYVNFTGALLHLSARRVVRNHVPTSSVPRIVISIGAGLILATYLALTN